MILFTILMLMLLLLVGLTVAAISVGGTVMVVLFGDVPSVSHRNLYV